MPPSSRFRGVIQHSESARNRRSRSSSGESVYALLSLTLPFHAGAKAERLLAAQPVEPRLALDHITGRFGREVHRFFVYQAPLGEGGLDVLAARTTRKQSPGVPASSSTAAAWRLGRQPR